MPVYRVMRKFCFQTDSGATHSLDRGALVSYDGRVLSYGGVRVDATSLRGAIHAQWLVPVRAAQETVVVPVPTPNQDRYGLVLEDWLGEAC